MHRGLLLLVEIEFDGTVDVLSLSSGGKQYIQKGSGLITLSLSERYNTLHLMSIQYNIGQKGALGNLIMKEEFGVPAHWRQLLQSQ